MNFIILLRQFNEMKDQIKALEERVKLLETRQNPESYLPPVKRSPGRPRKVDG